MAATAGPPRRAQTGPVVALTMALSGHAITITQLVATVLLAPSSWTHALSSGAVTGTTVAAGVRALLESTVRTPILRHTLTLAVSLALAVLGAHRLPGADLVGTVHAPEAVVAGASAVQAATVARAIVGAGLQRAVLPHPGVVATALELATHAMV